MSQQSSRIRANRTYTLYNQPPSRMSGLAALWSDLKESLLPVTAEAASDDAADAGADASDAGADAEEEEEEEEELVDPLDQLREEYTEGVCKPFKHHFDECVERVTEAMEDPDWKNREDKENCVEEFFHYQHCLDSHIAPVLFSKLK